MRQRDPLTTAEQRELAALDRALAGEPVDADLAALEQLVADVRATAPQMTPAFAARLEQEVATGFPSPAGRSQPRSRRRRWTLLPAAGALAAALVAVVVVLGAGEQRTTVSRDSAQLPDSARSPNSGGDEAVVAEARVQAPASATVDPAAGPPATAMRSGARGGVAAQSFDRATAPAKRRVERSAVLVLEAPDERFQATTDAVVRTVDRFRGIVQSSSIGSGDASGGEATFTLRIPTDKLDAALAALSKLGHVAERTQSLEDITGSFASVQERLSDARAERRGLLRALGRATTQQQIDSLRARLRSVNSTISARKGDLGSLRRRANLANVALTVRGGGADGGGAIGDPWTPGDAARDAVRVLEVSAGVALIALAVMLPLGLIGAAAAFGVQLGRRRQRERALEAA